MTDAEVLRDDRTGAGEEEKQKTNWDVLHLDNSKNKAAEEQMKMYQIKVDSTVVEEGQTRRLFSTV